MNYIPVGNQAAISALDLRWAIKVRISYSRPVNSGKNCAGPLLAVGREPAK